MTLKKFFKSKDMWESNIIIDSKINNRKINIAILRSSNSKIGVTERFVENHIHDIQYIMCDNENIAQKYDKEAIILSSDKEHDLFEACKEKRKNINPFVYTVIGSVGKTSVLGLLGRSLKRIQSKTYVNDFGNRPFYISKGILFSSLRAENWVFEVAGASKFKGEPISVISHDMLQPDVCIFTNIAEAHVGAIGSLKDIAIMKSKSLQNIPDSSIVILNGNMPYQDVIRSNINPCARVYTFGDSEESNFKLLKSEEGILKFRYDNSDYDVNIPKDLPQEIKLNFLSVTAALFLTKTDWRVACEYFSDWKPVKGRGNLEERIVSNKKINIINDSYNANPISMKLALTSLCKKDTLNRKIAVLGEIAELGDHRIRIHKDILDYISDLKIDKVILIGESYTKHIDSYIDNEKFTFFKDINIFKENFSSIILDNDLILFKGSHSSLLYDFLNKLD
ncbi:Mur ligase family protein [Ignatzschineria sp. LJL83]